METYIRHQQHKNFKHQDIKQKEPPQKYRLGTISNTKLLAGLNRFYMDFMSISLLKVTSLLPKGIETSIAYLYLLIEMLHNHHCANIPSICRVTFERFSQTCRNVGSHCCLTYPILSLIGLFNFLIVMIIEMPLLVCLKCILGKFQKPEIFC